MYYFIFVVFLWAPEHFCVTTGWIFEISLLCTNPINQSKRLATPFKLLCSVWRSLCGRHFHDHRSITLVSSDIVYYFIPPLNSIFQATEIFADRRYFATTDVPAGSGGEHGGDKEGTASHPSPRARFVDMQGVWAQISRHSRLLRGQQIRSPKRSS